MRSVLGGDFDVDPQSRGTLATGAWPLLGEAVGAQHQPEKEHALRYWGVPKPRIHFVSQSWTVVK